MESARPLLPPILPTAYRWNRRNRRNRRLEGTPGSVLLMLAAWTVLLGLPPLLESWLPTASAIGVSFLVVTILVLATRSFRRDRPLKYSGWLFLLGLLAGFASYPAWIVLIGLSGLALGLTLPSPPEAAPPVLWAATILLAPVFEEVLYRERLLTALGRTLGPSLAIPITSALFAISHLEPWRVLGTGLVGLMLGTAMRASGSLALCIGLHMGLNLAGLTSGVPPVGVSLPPSESAAAGLCVLGVAIVLARKW